MKAQHGFTLIEILVVLFIISIVTSVALLSISHNSHKQVESFANELTQLVTLAEEEAMLKPEVLGLMIEDDSFHFATWQRVKDNKNNAWVPLQESVLNKHKIPSDIEMRLVVGGVSPLSNETLNKNPQIIISTNGDVTPFTIYIGKKGQHPLFAVIANADGNVMSQALS